jgi:soluble lytic murein transglycosylase
VRLAFRRRGSVIVLALLGLGVACKHEPPPPAAIASTDAPADAPALEAEAKPAPRAPERALWFADGPGREAILARERGDHDVAIAQLEILLAQQDLSADDRAAAQWLRGLEDVRLGLHAAAADRFAEARKCDALASVEPRLRALEAQARLDGGDPAAALELAGGVALRKGSPLADDLRVIEADARLRTDDVAGARKAYEAYLAQHPAGGRRYEVAVKLARSLARSEAVADLRRAVELYEELVMSVPLSDFGEEAERALPKLRTRAGISRSAADAGAFTRRSALARIEAMIDRGRYTAAVKAVDELVKRAGVKPYERCQALFAKGTAVFKQRERAKARPHFEAAAQACAKTTDADARTIAVKAGYQAARGRYAEGKHEQAARAFEKLAKDHADHSYADDAWVLAGESWAEHGDDAKARAAWRKGLELRGDMREESRRRLLVAAFAAGDDAEALKLADGGLAEKGLVPVERAKLHYFRGRALARAGEAEEARAAWLAAIEVAPLDYPSLQSIGRLREAGDEAALARAGALLGAGAEAAQKSAVPAAEGAEPALVLARLGLGEWAQEELRAADVGGWPAVAVLNQAGLYAGAQKLLASMGAGWRADPPKGEAAARWRLAHPQPFLEIVVEGEPRLGVPAWLTYAIMQTESRFDPRATSYAGARGLIQLMPSTAKTVAVQAGVELGDEERLYVPTVNLELGMHHLGRLVARFGGGDAGVALAIPSYNAGAGAVEKWLDERRAWDLDVFIEGIPYDETRKYTQSVLGRWLAYRVLYGEGDDPLGRAPYLDLKLPAA